MFLAVIGKDDRCQLDFTNGKDVLSVVSIVFSSKSSVFVVVDMVLNLEME